MTVVVFASLKGAPGVTTLTTLVGATWPVGRKVVVVECDPSGGDLGARFRLSSRQGWMSFQAAQRRSGGVVGLGPHVQQLPGGLDVLVASRGADGAVTDRSMAALLSGAGLSPEGPWDVLVDLGRLPPAAAATAWAEPADAVVICAHRDAASLMHVRDRSAALSGGHDARVGLAVVGDGGHPVTEITQFTGLPVFGEIPFDPESAATAGGEQGGGRRLRRSLLATASSRLAAHLAGDRQNADEADRVLRSSEGEPAVTSPERRLDGTRLGLLRQGIVVRLSPGLTADPSCGLSAGSSSEDRTEGAMR